MPATNKKPILKDNETVDTVFNANNGMRLPIIWFCIMLLPVIFAMIVTLFNAENDIGVTDTRIVTEQSTESLKDIPPHIPNRTIIMGGTSDPDTIRREREQSNMTRNRTPCAFENFEGRLVNADLIQKFRNLDRPVSFLKEDKEIHIITPRDPRIYIYVNERTRRISRILCR